MPLEICEVTDDGIALLRTSSDPDDASLLGSVLAITESQECLSLKQRWIKADAFIYVLTKEQVVMVDNTEIHTTISAGCPDGSKILVCSGKWAYVPNTELT